MRRSTVRQSRYVSGCYPEIAMPCVTCRPAGRVRRRRPAKAGLLETLAYWRCSPAGAITRELCITPLMEFKAAESFRIPDARPFTTTISRQ